MLKSATPKLLFSLLLLYQLVAQSAVVVETKKNKFICYFQGWKSKVNEIKRFLGESDEYNQGYIVLNMIDKYTNKIDVEASTLSKKLEVLKL